MADLISPLASYAVAGQTTFNPGVRTNHISGFCEWKGPPWTPPPDGERITMGTPAFQRSRHLAAPCSPMSGHAGQLAKTGATGSRQDAAYGKRHGGNRHFMGRRLSAP